MSDTTSTVTLAGGTGGTVVEITNDYVRTHADIFQSMTVSVMAYGPSAYSYPPSDNAIVIPINQGDVSVTGLATSSALMVSDGNTLNYSGNGDATVYAGNGNDTATAGSGDTFIALGTGNNTVSLGSGRDTVYSEGTDHVIGSTGSAEINITGARTTIEGGTGALKIDDRAGAGSYISTHGTALIRGSDQVRTVIVATGDDTVTGGTAGVSYTQSSGSLEFIGNGGSVSIDGAADATNDSLYGASGTGIFLSSNTHNNIFVANDTLRGAGGPVSLDGSAASGGNQFWAGSGNATLIGGTGSDTLVAGQGSVSMTGGVGDANTFDIFRDGSGPATHVTISDFGAVSGNVMTLFGYGASGVDAALQSAHQSGSDVSLTLTDGTSVTLANYDATKLTHASFLYTDPTR